MTTIAITRRHHSLQLRKQLFYISDNESFFVFLWSTGISKLSYAVQNANFSSTPLHSSMPPVHPNYILCPDLCIMSVSMSISQKYVNFYTCFSIFCQFLYPFLNMIFKGLTLYCSY